jgi:hypothetical protein
MANANTPTTLGNLEFSDIKESLTNYLKNQSVFSGYNFEGSAMQSLIDLLSYNTFYYAYYANMINAEAFLDSAQKEDSMISLCKPLGFVVPSRTAAKATITLSGLTNTNTITAGTRFIASNSNGIEYSFYTLEDVAVVDETTEQFDIYEATRYISFDALPSFDYTAQRINIADTNFDLDSVKVTVTERIEDNTPITEDWALVGNIGYTAKLDENIYFIERTSTGFSILFGSTNSVGRSIDSSIEKIIVRYITTSGSVANELSLFRYTNGIVQLVSESTGGREKPDLDYVRFIAPKWFAAQERAVTVNDYKALLLQSGFFESDRQFNVFGGQDLSPPRYGRVFVTSTYSPSDQVISDMIQFLKERSVITILPEYISPNSFEVYVTFTFALGPATENTTKNRSRILTKVKSIFNSNYATVDQFNVSFSASDFIDILKVNSDPDINTLLINADDFTIYVKKSLESNKQYNFKFENALYLPLNTSIPITEQFASDLVASGTNAILKMYARTNGSKNVRTNLELWQVNADGEETQISANVGSYIAANGSITINSGVIKSNALLNVEFLKKNFMMKLDQSITLNLDENVRLL